MICAKCGGDIHADSSCEKCGIGFDEMIDSISHDEMRKLFSKIRELISNGQSIDIEVSLLACELINSSLLAPTDTIDGNLSFRTVFDERKNKFILLFTDRQRYDGAVTNNATITTGPFDAFLALLEGDDVEGFLINAGTDSCKLEKDFLDQYFLGE